MWVFLVVIAGMGLALVKVRRQRKKGNEGPELPAGQRKIAPLRADERKAPQHAHAHGRWRQLVHIRVTQCAYRESLRAIHACRNSA